MPSGRNKRVRSEAGDIEPTANARFGKDDFIYKHRNEYRCPAGQRLIWRFKVDPCVKTEMIAI